jgi:succinate dehydrogenase / fumarate reductase membrane anchor subunit
MTPRTAGSAHSGLGEWLAQRLTALYMAGFGLVVVGGLILRPPQDYTAWKAWVTSPAVSIALMLFFASAIWHTWIGMRSVYMDYLHPLWLRFAVSALTAVGLLALLLWVGQVLLWRVGA